MLEFKQRRNRDFLATVNRLLRDPRYENLTLREIIAMAAKEPAPDYYITYSNVIKRLPSVNSDKLPVGDRTGRAQMWAEIIDKVNHRVEKTGCSRADAVAHVLGEGNASSFFIKDSSAWVIYHNIMNGSPTKRHHRKSTKQ